MTTLVPFARVKHRIHVKPAHTVSLSVNWKKSETMIIMSLNSEEVTTRNMPHVLPILRKHLPTILRSTCFNEEDIPFAQEVKATELGHLFEHILLEYLCKEKIRLGSKEAVFSGITKWDWNRYPYGTFHIHVTMAYEDRVFFASAFQKATQLFTLILQKQSEVKKPFLFQESSQKLSV